MEIVIKIAQFILSLSLLVFIHELGHFLFARMFGIRVDKFYLFFDWGFSLVKFRIGETEFGIGWIPFGGYCKIAGMIDESMDKEQMKQPPQPWEFRSKPAWQRLLVMLGGVMMNVLLAICIYIGMSHKYGETYVANDDLAYGWSFNELGEEMGFRDGDKIVSVDGNSYVDHLYVWQAIMIANGPEVEILRDESPAKVSVPKEFTSRKLDAPRFMSPRTTFVVDSIMPGSNAAAAGFEKGDSLAAFNGVPLRYFDEFAEAFTESKGGEAEITVVRDSAGVAVPRTLAVAITDDGKIGVGVKGLPITHIKYSWLKSIPAGVKRTGAEISGYWNQLKLIANPKSGIHKQLGSVIAIGNIFPEQWDWFRFWHLTAMLSVVLAVMNILPIPALDGGHVLFLLYEMVTRRKPSDKFMEYAQMAGMLLIFGLMIFLFGNDIYRIFIK